MKSISAILMTILFSIYFTACGRGTEQTTTHQPEPNIVEKALNENNYIDIAQYHYLKESTQVSLTTSGYSGDSKVMQKLTEEAQQNEPGVFYVESVKTPENFIYYLKVTCDDATVSLTTDENKQNVTINFIDGEVTKTQTVQLDSFTATGVEVEVELNEQEQG
ncbi:MAG: hypothetical protein K0U47_05055 [Epsilonproteobacteria bacterium]|nr:hypothetical protein [Campylobacterota bacterium]